MHFYRRKDALLLTLEILFILALLKASSFGPDEGFPFLFQGWDAIEIWWKGNLGLLKRTFRNFFHNLQVTMLGENVAVITGYEVLII